MTSREKFLILFAHVALFATLVFFGVLVGTGGCNWIEVVF